MKERDSAVGTDRRKERSARQAGRVEGPFNLYADDGKRECVCVKEGVGWVRGLGWMGWIDVVLDGEFLFSKLMNAETSAYKL